MVEITYSLQKHEYEEYQKLKHKFEKRIESVKSALEVEAMFKAGVVGFAGGIVVAILIAWAGS